MENYGQFLINSLINRIYLFFINRHKIKQTKTQNLSVNANNLQTFIVRVFFLTIICILNKQ